MEGLEEKALRVPDVLMLFLYPTVSHVTDVPLTYGNIPLLISACTVSLVPIKISLTGCTAAVEDVRSAVQMPSITLLIIKCWKRGCFLGHTEI